MWTLSLFWNPSSHFEQPDLVTYFEHWEGQPGFATLCLLRKVIAHRSNAYILSRNIWQTNESSCLGYGNV